MRPLVPLALVAGTLGLWLLWSRGRAGAAAHFDPYALTELSWYLLGAGLAAGCLAIATRPRLGMARALKLLATQAPMALLIAFAIEQFPRWPVPWLIGAMLLLIGAALLLATRQILDGWQLPAVSASCLLLSLFALGGHYFYFPAQLWYPADSASAPEASPEAIASDPAALETLLFSQPEQIDAALDRLGPRALGPSAWFLGFAGYAEEKVFAEEVRYAARVLDERYGSGQRTLFLLNDRRDRQRQPLATVSGLRRALAGMATQMRTDSDLLILFISSHGAENAELVVSNGDLPLGPLTGPVLAAALDDAGIRWRLIIVSACFAGGFLPHLANDETIVLTAAAPDRTSFGCSNERDLTWFGEALLRDAVPQGGSLEQVFEQARTAVTAREKQLGAQPSRPVAHFGAALTARLAQGVYR
ncbi:MAG: C13 family peptidase [Pseudomonadota bacterium]